MQARMGNGRTKLKNSTLAGLILFAGGGFLLFAITFNGVVSASYADLSVLLETTTAALGTLLGIITAGLMFTQGKYGELIGELDDKSPHYLRSILSLEELRSIGEDLHILTRLFDKLADETNVLEEKQLYERIVERSSIMFINIAILLNLKLKQERITGTSLLISEMSPTEHRSYQEKSQALKKDWQLFTLIKQTIDAWESAKAIPTPKNEPKPPLRYDIASTIPVLKLNEEMHRSPEKTYLEVEKTLKEVDARMDKIATRFHEDRIPQLLTQMDQATIVRGKYFYITLIFIAAPLLVNLLVLPQFSEGTSMLLRDVVAVTSVLSVLGVVVLLFYIHKMLNV